MKDSPEYNEIEFIRDNASLLAAARQLNSNLAILLNFFNFNVPFNNYNKNELYYSLCKFKREWEKFNKDTVF